jgi:hypothetical protein
MPSEDDRIDPVVSLSHDLIVSRIHQSIPSPCKGLLGDQRPLPLHPHPASLHSFHHVKTEGADPDVVVRLSTGHGHTTGIRTLGRTWADGLMGGLRQRQPAQASGMLSGKHSITVERDIKLTTDTLVVYTPPEHATSLPRSQ